MEAADWKQGDILFDDLRLEKAVGTGAFGEVWRARQLSWDKAVAVKRVKAYDEKRIRSMEQEAIHWLEIGLHPYVTTCYYTRRYEGAPVIVLEYASEGALDHWIKDGRLLFEAQASALILKFGLEAAWGLACAHRTGLLHLDVKPANILIENGLAKITDFGIASRLGQELTSSGTRAFASPEQLSREDVDEKADVFSWAVTLFALFKQEVNWAVGIAAPEILEDEWAIGALPLEMPEDVYRLLLACMSENPASRPKMEEAAEDLSWIMQAEYPEIPLPAKVVDRQPLTAAEYNNRAVYMHETGDLQGAEKYFRIAVETASDITTPQYNRGLADYYAGRINPVKLLEENLNKGQGSLADENIVAARILMLNGDARSIAESPKLIAASPAAEAWLEKGAPGSLSIESPHTARYIKPDDREKLCTILTQGGLKAFNRNPNATPVDFIVSPKRKTLIFDNDKGAILLGGLNSGGEPWTTCVIFRDKLKLKTAQFLGENAFSFLDNIDNTFKICDFSDPENLVFSGMPNTPELKALGSVSYIKIECLDNVSCILVQGVPAMYAVLILDMTEGIKSARTKVSTMRDWRMSYPQMPGTQMQPDIAFQADGSVLVNRNFRIRPEEWGGTKREACDPDEVLPSNNTGSPIAKIMGNFGSTITLIRHSADFHDISSQSGSEAYEYACMWRIAPYRFLSMAFDDTPAKGGSLVLDYEGEFFISRIDKGDTPPPERVEWLMMKAVSGAVAKDRRDTALRAAEDYERLLRSGDFGGVMAVADTLRPLLDSRDENVLALWQRIARDFPHGAPLFATECEAVRSDNEISHKIRHPKPVYPGLPFTKASVIGKIRFKYHYTNSAGQDIPILIVENGASPPRRFYSVGKYQIVAGAEGSEDGLIQALVYPHMGDDGRLIVGRRGILIRVIDVRGPDCVLEIFRPGLQTQEIFMRWSQHTLLLFIGGEGIHVIDFDKAQGLATELPLPIIPDIVDIHDAAFMGAHSDELFTGENRWRFYYEILPFPERPFDDPRLEILKPMLPRKPDEKRAMLLRNGFGNLWTEYLLVKR